ncbi:hypothetical protein EJF36_15550 [Bacillus sp. HMF5848]|uniref:hypothetical protein n=1 Tax=Bacillus sp. HMF5848 TaxID=2495421 RepID=UPI000F7B7B63|nr:hypothetical protein [Bacillus sp. HMF5848]RSK28184.1 hypothetical protein EJF36_15550 [Bacillus sp. HMF5848]
MLQKITLTLMSIVCLVVWALVFIVMVQQTPQQLVKKHHTHLTAINFLTQPTQWQPLVKVDEETVFNKDIKDKTATTPDILLSNDSQAVSIDDLLVALGLE